MSKVTLQNYRFYREQGGWKVLFEVSILSKYYSTPIKALKKMEIHLLGLFFFLYSNYYAISMANA